jgi:ParB family transcriptional regulator, chromosome partitioning protein
MATATATLPLPRGTGRLGRLVDVPVDLIDIGDNVRSDPGSVAELEELAENIREVGLLQPITVEGPDRQDRYRLVYGQRRLLAFRRTGAPRIPAVVHPLGDADGQAPGWRATEQLVENLQRRDLSPLEEAQALRSILAADPELSQADLAKRLGRSAPWVSNTLRILDTAKPVQQLLANGELTGSHVKVIAGVPKEHQEAVAQEAVRRGLSAHDLEGHAKWMVEQAERAARHEAEQAETRKAQVGRILAALPKRGAQPGDPVQVATGWNGDGAARPMVDALKAAGYKVTTTSNPAGTPSKQHCDCRAWTVAIGYSSEVSRRCIEPAHSKAASAASDARYKAKQDLGQADVKAARAAIGASLEAHPLDRPFAEILLWQLLGQWQREDWAKRRQPAEPTGDAGGRPKRAKVDPWAAIRALTDAELHAELAMHIAAHDAPPLAAREGTA